MKSKDKSKKPHPKTKNHHSKIRNIREEMHDWLSRLKESDKFIIVEGIKDKKALINMGIESDRIIPLTKAIYAVAEHVATKTKKAIILTDLDKEGRKLYAALKTDLSRNGVEVDNYFREFLFAKSDLTHIEGIGSYFKRLYQESGFDI
jgi:5S rRNA maturation endonuclease (ribonuclease M5)